MACDCHLFGPLSPVTVEAISRTYEVVSCGYEDGLMVACIPIAEMASSGAANPSTFGSVESRAKPRCRACSASLRGQGQGLLIQLYGKSVSSAPKSVFLYAGRRTSLARFAPASGAGSSSGTGSPSTRWACLVAPRRRFERHCDGY